MIKERRLVRRELVVAAEPARAPLARTAQGHLRQPHAHDGKFLDAHLRRRVSLGKQRDLLRRVVVLAEERDGLAPGRLVLRCFRWNGSHRWALASAPAGPMQVAGGKARPQGEPHPPDTSSKKPRAPAGRSRITNRSGGCAWFYQASHRLLSSAPPARSRRLVHSTENSEGPNVSRNLVARQANGNGGRGAAPGGENRRVGLRGESGGLLVDFSSIVSLHGLMDTGHYFVSLASATQTQP